MTDGSFSTARLERSLEAIGRSIDYPPEPDIARAVRRRIAAGPRRRAGWASVLASLTRPAAAAVAAVVVLSVFMIVSEPARVAVADWLGFDDVRITFEPPPERAVAEHLGLGERVSLEAAEDRAAFDVLIPAELGEPDEVYFDDRVSSGMVSLVYAARSGLPESGGDGAGLIVTQFEATLDDSEVFTKFVRFDAVVSEVEVRGLVGYWIGAPHDLFFRDVEGEENFEASRLAGPALVWQEEGVVVRIESELDRAGSIDVAESLE